MAGDWIKVEKATPLKPEVLAISEQLQIHPTHAFGLCVRFWMWCDDQLKDGNARSVTKVTLDFAIGHQGFTDALLKVDWLRDRSGSLEVPHFDRHLSEGAKTRSLTKERVRKAKEKSNAGSVSKVTHAALAEKRREESCIIHSTRKTWTLDEVKAAGALASISPEVCKLYHDSRESIGWVDRNAIPIKSMAHDLAKFAAHYADNARRQPARSTNGQHRPKTEAQSKYINEF